MGSVAGGRNAAPLYVYTGHDTTIMPMLATLGIQLHDWPPYLSNVVSANGPKLVSAPGEKLLADTVAQSQGMEMTDYACVYVQIFELWERADMSANKPCFYVKCIYNYEDLSLAHHSNGQSSACQHTLPSRLCHSVLFTYLPSCMLVPSMGREPCTTISNAMTQVL